MALDLRCSSPTKEATMAYRPAICPSDYLTNEVQNTTAAITKPTYVEHAKATNPRGEITIRSGQRDRVSSSPLPLRLQVKVTRTRSLTLGDGSHFVPSLENWNSWLIHRVWEIDNKNYFCPRLLLPNQSVHSDLWHQKEGIYLQQVFQCSYLETRSGRFFTELINNENKSLVAALTSVLEISPHAVLPFSVFCVEVPSALSGTDFSWGENLKKKKSL